MSGTKELVRKLKLLAEGLDHLFHNPASFPSNIRMIFRAWRAGGTHAVKGTLLGLARAAGAQTWVRYREKFVKSVRPRIAQHIREHGAPVKISIIVPTFNTSEKMLREMLQSVREQLYPNWELCIADDGSTQPQVKRVLEELAAVEPRIKLHLGQENRGVSHASNRALDMVTSPFVVLLDHDDLLEEQALFRVAQAIQADDPDMVYSDEIMVSPDLKNLELFIHRPAFSPEFLRSHPYIVHMVGFRTSLLREVGGFDEALRISQDYDLILRVSERARTIVHLPEILYRWRIHPSSSGQQKMKEVMDISTAVLQRHLDRTGVDGVMGPGISFNFFQARYPLDPVSRIAIIIPTKNMWHLVRQCIDSIYRTVSGVRFDIILIDHESNDPDSIKYFESLGERVRLLHYTGPFNFSTINNWAVKQLEREYSHYLFCNNDIEALHEGWLERMLEACQQDSVGMVGAELLYGDKVTIQHAGVLVGAYGAAEHYGKFMRVPTEHPELYMGRLFAMHEVSAVTAACLLMRREVFDEIGGYDEALAVGFGDVDLCLRTLERGWRILYCPQASLIHHESITRGKTIGDPHPEDSAKFVGRYAKFLVDGDPYHNPGLSLRNMGWGVMNPLPCSFDIRRRVFERDMQTGRQRLRVS